MGAAVLLLGVAALLAACSDALSKQGANPNAGDSTPVCSLQPVRGPCTGHPKTAFYWDAPRHRCRRFTYGGCGGNANRFAHKRACRAVCALHEHQAHHGGRNGPTAKRSVPKRPAYCHASPDPGFCAESSERILRARWYYYYDAHTHACSMFWFWGCGGNRNKFADERHCERKCGHKGLHLRQRGSEADNEHSRPTYLLAISYSCARNSVPKSHTVIAGCAKCDIATSTCQMVAADSYECQCRQGFLPDPNTGICTDVDECAASEHLCTSNALCINTIGSYRCECVSGYAGDGYFSCVQIPDAILQLEEQHGGPLCSGCHPLADCVNGRCVCRDGWQGDGLHCRDVDECVESAPACHENAACVNTDGAYYCECRSGFAGDGRTHCTTDRIACYDDYDPASERACLGGDWKRRWHWHRHSRTCDVIWWDGCATSSRNLFSDRRTCLRMCAGGVAHGAGTHVDVYANHIAPACMDEFDETFAHQCGEANWERKVFFNRTASACEYFWFDQCPGVGRNIFDDLPTCQWMCQGGDTPQRLLLQTLAHATDGGGGSDRIQTLPEHTGEQVHANAEQNTGQPAAPTSTQPTASGGSSTRRTGDYGAELDFGLPAVQTMDPNTVGGMPAAVPPAVSPERGGGSGSGHSAGYAADWQTAYGDAYAQTQSDAQAQPVHTQPYDLTIDADTEQVVKYNVPPTDDPHNLALRQEKQTDAPREIVVFTTQSHASGSQTEQGQQHSGGNASEGTTQQPEADTTTNAYNSVFVDPTLTNKHPFCWEAFDKSLENDCGSEVWLMRYYYQHDLNKCVQFWYNGCPIMSVNIFEQADTCIINCKAGDTVITSVEANFGAAALAPQRVAGWDGTQPPTVGTMAPTRGMTEHLRPEIDLHADDRLRPTQRPVGVSTVKDAGGQIPLSESDVCLDAFDMHLADQCGGALWTDRYYFNHTLGTCELFWWDGCDSAVSSNNFDTLELCRMLCQSNVEVQIAVATGRSTLSDMPSAESAERQRGTTTTDFDLARHQAAMMRKRNHLKARRRNILL